MRHEGRYGHRRVHDILRRQGRECSVELVRQIMAQAGLRAAQPRKWQVTTRPDKLAAAGVRDLVRRDFTADTPGAKLVADITYVHTWQGWMYLATVIDCYSRAVVGWAVADHMRTELVIDAIEMAARSIHIPEGAIFHSDRGCQGEFERWSQHLDFGGGYGSGAGLDDDADGSAGDAFAGSSAGLAA